MNKPAPAKAGEVISTRDCRAPYGRSQWHFKLERRLSCFRYDASS